MAEAKTEPILTRVAKATASVGVLGKDRTNTHDGYDYLSEAAVKRAVQQAIAEFDIAPQSIHFEVLSDEWRDARSGQANYVKIRCILTWNDESFAEGLGCGRDYGDKAILKAQTAAVREAWKNRLTIPTGEDPEKDDARAPRSNDRARPAPRPQQRQAAPQQARKPASTPPPKPSNGNGEAPKPSKLENDLTISLIAELNKRERPADLKDWADGLLKLPPQQRAPLWAAFGDRCQELKLDPGKTARTGEA